MGIGCLFNWDGAVVSSMDHHLKAWNLFADETNKSLPDGFIKQAYGKKTLWILSNLLKWTNEKDEIFHLRNRKETIYQEIIQNDPPPLVDGIDFFIKDLVEHDIPCVVTTSLSRKSFDVEAKLTNMVGLFSAIISAEHYVQEKPSPEVYLRASKSVHVASSQGIVFENTAFGIEAASSGGFQIVSIDPNNCLKNEDEIDLRISNYLNLSYQTIENL